MQVHHPVGGIPHLLENAFDKGAARAEDSIERKVQEFQPESVGLGPLGQCDLPVLFSQRDDRRNAERLQVGDLCDRGLPAAKEVGVDVREAIQLRSLPQFLEDLELGSGDGALDVSDRGWVDRPSSRLENLNLATIDPLEELLQTRGDSRPLPCVSIRS